MLLAGCATQPSISRASFHQGPPHLEVLELPPTVADRPLRRVLHDNHEEVTAAALTADRQRISQSLEASLRESVH
jgi:hypothetical protein